MSRGPTKQITIMRARARAHAIQLSPNKLSHDPHHGGKGVSRPGPTIRHPRATPANFYYFFDID